MHVKYLHIPINRIIPKFDGKPAKDMHAQPPPCGIVFDKIKEIGREYGNLAATPD